MKTPGKRMLIVAFDKSVKGKASNIQMKLCVLFVNFVTLKISLLPCVR